jgi:hypothetical protein
MAGGAPKGNKNGSNGKPITAVLRRLVAQNPQRIANMWEEQFKAAEAGNLYAFNAIMDRLEGKPVQSTELSSPDGEKVITAIAFSIIKPDDKQS